VTAPGPGPLALLAREFPEWEITIRPAGLNMATAYWRSGDGRHRRLIVARSAAGLLAELRAKAAHALQGPGAPAPDRPAGAAADVTQMRARGVIQAAESGTRCPRQASQGQGGPGRIKTSMTGGPGS
jgi:hypothetical protein